MRLKIIPTACRNEGGRKRKELELRVCIDMGKLIVGLGIKVSFSWKTLVLNSAKTRTFVISCLANCYISVVDFEMGSIFFKAAGF
jgi:hypothetical protein